MFGDGAFGAMGSLTGGGGLSMPSSAQSGVNSSNGQSVGAINFGISNSKLLIISVVVLIAVWAFRK